ncbi:MAG: hypothetical protein ACR2P4_09655 [Gammaproteobacteria bacterium]
MMKRAALCLFVLALFFATSSCGKKAPLRYPPAAANGAAQR